MSRTLTCIECPIGCLVSVEMDGEEILSITGNGCPRGRVYAENEVTCPRRIVTSTVRAKDGQMLPVKTDRAVKKTEVFSVMEKIKRLRVIAPIKIGDVVYEEIAEGCNLVATGNLEEK